MLYERPVRRFMHLWYEMDLVVPYLGEAHGPSDGLQEPGWIAGASVAEVVRFGTAILRGDRFSEGLLGKAVESGAVAAVVARLSTWRETE
jgi:hypothetical protein